MSTDPVIAPAKTVTQANELVSAIDNAGVSPKARARIYIAVVVVSFLMGLAAALIPIFARNTIALEIVAAIGVVGSWAGTLGAGLAVAYKPSDAGAIPDTTVAPDTPIDADKVKAGAGALS